MTRGQGAVRTESGRRRPSATTPYPRIITPFPSSGIISGYVPAELPACLPSSSPSRPVTG
jgi:hypothetical protein